MTQNGFLQTVTRGYGNKVTGKYGNAISIQQAFHKMSQAISVPRHTFLPDDISLLDTHIVAHRHIQGHRQLTDTYLLALSVSHSACFVTLDRRVSLDTVPQATDDSLYVIIP